MLNSILLNKITVFLINSKLYELSALNQTFYFFEEKRCVGLPRRRASVGVNQKIFENLQRRQRRLLTVSVRITLNRFSIFSESGQKHCLGCPFLCFVSFGYAKEMKAKIPKNDYKKSYDLVSFFKVLELGLNKQWLVNICKINLYL